MTRLSLITGGNAKTGGEGTCTNSGNSLPLINSVMRVARGLWPTKTAMELAARTGASERMCKYWLAHRYSLSGDDLADLLRSDEGLQVLEAVMGQAKPQWWRRVKKSAKRSALRAAQKDLQQQIDQMEMDID